jgi:magnesium-transporting ATPase (P-type)
MIERFMLVMGPVSTVFDMLTFAMLLLVFHAGETFFRTGWFVESLVTQILMIFAVRTRRHLFASKRFGELDTLVPAYAATIHKSQGSEYPAVVIPVLTQHYAMLQRNLLYTGVTRGKQLVVLVGQKKAVAIAVRNVSGRRRWSKLNEWLAVHVGE